MSLPTLATTSIPPTDSQTVPIVILGTDAMLAALPATPAQLAHACRRAGFANVIPASWGDELVASAVLRQLPEFGGSPVIQCSCPIVAHRLLAVGADLRPVLLPVVPPPVAAARYIRALSHPARARVTYVGNCPGAMDDSIDIRMTPEALIDMLAERGISLHDQPRAFESVLAPDRRRFRSQPGGVPSAEALWTEVGSRGLVEIDGEDLVSEVAQHVLNGRNVLIDVSTRLGCACSGAVAGTSRRDARSLVVINEPTRSAAAVVDERVPIPLDLELPAASRSPVDVMATQPNTAARRAVAPAHRTTPVNELRPPRNSGSSTLVRAVSSPRSVTPPRSMPAIGGKPSVRKAEGKMLPRAFIVRRRSPPPQKGAPPATPSSAAPLPEQPSLPDEKTDAPITASDAPSVHLPKSTPTHQVIL